MGGFLGNGEVGMGDGGLFRECLNFTHSFSFSSHQIQFFFFSVFHFLTNVHKNTSPPPLPSTTIPYST